MAGRVVYVLAQCKIQQLMLAWYLMIFKVRPIIATLACLAWTFILTCSVVCVSFYNLHLQQIDEVDEESREISSIGGMQLVYIITSDKVIKCFIF